MKYPMGTHKVVRTKTGKFTSIKARIVFGLGRLWLCMKWATAFAVVAVIAWVHGSGVMVNEAYAENIFVPHVQKESKTAVMARIADCESGDRIHGKVVKGSAKQFNSDGSIVMHLNNDGTTDVGEFQINMQPDHIRNLARLHFDAMTKEGNEAYANWIYENVGTKPWESSRSCWE